MKYNVQKPRDICMTAEQVKRFFDFIMGDDLDFYEKYTINLTDEEQEKFFKDNPDFMSKYHISKCIFLLKDKMYREILRKISTYNKS